MSEHEESGGIHVLVFPSVALAVAIILNEANSRIKFLNIPDSVLLFAFSMLTNLLINLFVPNEVRTPTLGKISWEKLPANTVLVVLLPPLIFESSFKINSHMFFSKFKLICALTIFVYTCTMVICSILLIPTMFVVEQWYMSMSLLLSSILAATDPVAVVAILEEQGAPVRLRLLVESESLLNDGVALFAYQVIRNFLEHEIAGAKIDVGMHLKSLFFSMFVSPIFGIIMAKLTVYCINHLRLHMAKKQVLLVLMVYLVFYIGSQVGSSVLALVFYGVWMSYEKEQMSPDYVATATELWHSLAYWTDAAIFCFAGQATATSMFSHNVNTNKGFSYLGMHDNHLWSVANGVILAIIPLAARTTSVWMFKMVKVCGRPMRASDCVLLSYAGLRGALSLILALELQQHMRDTLPGDEHMWIGRQIMIATSTSVFFCLIAQATTYAFFTKKEGATKRSKYMNETEKKLQAYLRRKVLETLAALHLKNVYLSGTKWDVVRETVMDCMIEEKERETEDVKENENESSMRSLNSLRSAWESSEDIEEEMTDARSAYYTHLLAKVHDSWTRGALSGNTAQVILQLLEHAIDEGKLVLIDFVEQVEEMEVSWLFAIIYSMFDQLVKWVDKSTLFILCSQIGPHDVRDTKPQKNKIRYKMNRSMEKGFIGSTLLLCIYTGFLYWMVFDLNTVDYPQKEKAWNLAILLGGFFVCLMGIYENTHHCRYMCSKLREAKEGVHLPLPITYYRSRLIINAVHLVIYCCIFSIPSMMMWRGTCASHQYLNKESTECTVYIGLLLFLFSLICIYKLSRATLMLLFFVHEQLVEYKLSVDRIRLSFLHYLDHLSGDEKIPRDLFSPAAMKTVIKEQHHFTMCVEAVFRHEFKKRVELMNVLPVIKTRQAIRMASHMMEMLVNQLKSDGLMYGELLNSIEERVSLLRKQPARLLWAPQLEFTEWLSCSNWFQYVPLMNRDELLKGLNKQLRDHSSEMVPAGKKIELGGKSVVFVKNGLVHMSEWLVRYNDTKAHMSNEAYAMQGDFLGIRNIMTAGTQFKKLPLKWPKTAFLTRTACEIVRIDAQFLADKLKIMYKQDNFGEVCNIVDTLGKAEQLRRCSLELRELPKAYRGLLLDTFENFYTKGGKIIHSKEKIHVKEGHLLLMGCWTELVRLRPRTSLTSELNIEGPAEATVTPVDKRIGGLVLLIKLQTSEGTLARHPGSNDALEALDSRSVLVNNNLQNCASQRSNISLNAPVKEETRSLPMPSYSEIFNRNVI